MQLKDAVIVDGVRTPIGRAHKDKGWFRNTRPDDMAVALVKALLARNPKVKPAEIEDVVLGCANQSGVQGVNAARFVAMMAGLPFEVSGTTVDRQCASAMTATHNAAMQIMTGNAEVCIAGGFESMSMVPMGSGFEMNPRVAEIANPFEMLMGSTAEKVAKVYKVSREDQDRFAYASHKKAAAAHKEGRFKDEIVPVEGLDDAGNPRLYDADQTVRADASVEKMATLMPAFDPAGSVTAGNSSPLNDGAAALLLMSAEKAASLGARPMARIAAMAIAGVDPTVMGVGPVPAVRKALARAGLQAKDLNLVEINEAFASQALYCLRELGIPEERANVNGGAIAIGHPLGCSGARILVTLAHEMRRRKAKYGLGTLCIGFGMGAATVLEGM